MTMSNVYQKLKPHQGHKLRILAPGGFEETGGLDNDGIPGVAVLQCKTCDCLVLDAGEFDDSPDPRPEPKVTTESWSKEELIEREWRVACEKLAAPGFADSAQGRVLSWESGKKE
jgi:hypothetical protein